MIASRSFWGMSPCIALTVKLFSRIFSVSQSTCRAHYIPEALPVKCFWVLFSFII